MPPQQPDRLLDLFYEAFDFGAHFLFCLRSEPLLDRIFNGPDVATYAAKRNPLEPFPFR
jgi:hypothetical protein